MELGRRELLTLALGGALAGCGGGAKSGGTDAGAFNALAIQGIPDRLTLGEAFTPKVEALYSSGFSSPQKLGILPADALRWRISSEALRQEGERFVAVRPGFAQLDVEASNAAGRTASAPTAVVGVQSPPPPGRRKLAPLHPLSSPLYRGKLIGTTSERAAILLVDPITDARTALPLPEAGPWDFFPDPMHDCVWIIAPFRQVLWRMELPGGQFTQHLSASDLLLVSPLPSPRHLLVQRNSTLSLYVDGEATGATLPLRTLPPSPQVSDDTLYVLTDTRMLQRYRVSGSGFELLGENPWLSGTRFTVQGDLLAAADGTVRDARTLEVRQRWTVPANGIWAPRFSPEGHKVLFSGGTNLLQILVGEVATGRTLADAAYFVEPSGTLLTEPFFLSESQLAYPDASGVTVLDGLL